MYITGVLKFSKKPKLGEQFHDLPELEELLSSSS